ncbi:MAG: DNA cytosine methyltransferase [Nocardioides sp.]
MSTRPRGFDLLDDFAGPGGWDHAAWLLGLAAVGIERDHSACRTAAAAGYARIRTDVTIYPCEPFTGVAGYAASPPCPLFSTAGKGTGRRALDLLTEGVTDLFAGVDTRGRFRHQVRTHHTAPARAAENRRRPAVRRWDPTRVDAAAAADAESVAAILEPARRITTLRPEWVALEQVPAALPIWQVYADHLRRLGYSTWSGILCAADYGVPQTRHRAILMASRTRAIRPPAPTHAEVPQGLDLFGQALSPWVSFGQALGWGPTGEPAATVSAGGTGAGGAEPFANHAYRRRIATAHDTKSYICPARGTGITRRHGTRPDHPSTRPAPTVTGKARSWVIDRRTNSRGPAGSTIPTPGVSVDRPAPTVTGKTGGQWVLRPDETAPVYVNGNQPHAARRSVDQPAPTVLFGHRANDVRVLTHHGSRRITPMEAGILQSFPATYPWHGSRTKQYEQIGDAIPPTLAAHILAALTGRPLGLDQQEDVR